VAQHVFTTHVPVSLCGALGSPNPIYVAFGGTAVNGVVMPVPTFVPICGALLGDGVFFSIYDNAGTLHFVITLPGVSGVPGSTTAFSLPDGGAVFDHAVALADWNGTMGSGMPPVVSADTRVTQFFNGRFTTVGGIRGTFRNPAWTLTPWGVTSNGQPPPLGTLLASPSYLWTNDAMPGDAFGVWLRAS
jgi:hypothetical protein